MNYSILDNDLYQFNMAAAAFEAGIHETHVTFEGFVRKLPSEHNFLVFAGLTPLLEYLAYDFGVQADELVYLKSLPQYSHLSEDFWTYLYKMRFSCDVRALPEGTVFFENEPFISVTGPMIQVQLIETLLLSVLNYSTAVASKAARVRLAAGPSTSLSEFGFRRAPSPGAALLASRAAVIGGFDTTSNVHAGFEHGLPLAGTMAHSWVMLHNNEADAFQNYGKTFPNGVSALIDTYDPLRGTRKAVDTLKDGLKAVRLDSGDKVVVSRQMRLLLDEAGRPDVRIIVSDDMNEHKIRVHKLVEAPIDGYGVGTELVTPPALGGVFKLVQIDDKDGLALYKVKHAEGKSTYPGRKQIYRYHWANGNIAGDEIGLDGDSKHGTPLLKPVMVLGRIVYYESIDTMKNRCYADIKSLESKYKSLDETYKFDVKFSDNLELLFEQMMEK